jgi:hypothetical protein
VTSETGTMTGLDHEGETNGLGTVTAHPSTVVGMFLIVDGTTKFETLTTVAVLWC